MLSTFFVGAHRGEVGTKEGSPNQPVERETRAAVELSIGSFSRLLNLLLGELVLLLVPCWIVFIFDGGGQLKVLSFDS